MTPSQGYTNSFGAEIGDKVQVYYYLTVDNAPREDGEFETYLGPKAQSLKGFWEGIVGMKIGNEKRVILPSGEGYTTGELAGKELTFDITLQKIIENVRGDNYITDSVVTSPIDQIEDAIDEPQGSVIENLFSSPVFGAVTVVGIIAFLYIRSTGSTVTTITKETTSDVVKRRMKEAEEKFS